MTSNSPESQDRRRLRAAVIGSGFIGPHHVDAIRRGGYADVVVLAGHTAAHVESKAAALGLERWTTDVDSVIGDPAIDVIHVCTRNTSHVPLGEAALRAGKHVVMEKPLAVDSAGAARLVAAAQAADRHAATTFTYRGYPMLRKARALVAAGELGEVHLAGGAYLQDWLAEETDWNWRVDPAEGASRAVADIGVHWFDTLEFVSGLRVQAVFADLATFLPSRQRPAAEVEAFGSVAGPTETVRIESEDAAAIVMRLTGGARAVCLVSQVSPGRKNGFTLELGGSLRSLAWDQEQPERLWLGSRREPARLIDRDPAEGYRTPGVPPLPAGHPEAWSDALRDLLRPFYAAVASGTPPSAAAAVPTDTASVGSTAGSSSNLPRSDTYPTFADGARAVRFVEAVLESARGERWADL
jgi:predicted dehydrogenase